MNLKTINFSLPTSIFILVFFILANSGCKSDYDEWVEQAVLKANTNNNITQNEFEELINIIEINKGSFKNFVNPDKTINQIKVRLKLLKIFAEKNVTILDENIYNPEVHQTPLVSKFNVNVYLENSASMDGYVKGKTDFETSIYSMLGDIKTNGFCNNLNLNYINKTIHPVGPDIEDFIDKLEPNSFKIKGGDRSTSDLSDVLKTVIKNVDSSNLSVLISDFVFSPGKKINLDARDYLNNQMLGIRLTFSEVLQRQNLSVVILQMTSKFAGDYYDLTDKPHYYSGNRPYYIWLIGTDNQIRTILQTKILSNIKGGSLNSLVLSKISKTNPISYKINKSHKIGNFELPNGAQGPIESAQYDEENQKGVFGFSFYANFSNEINNSSFYSDTSNYKVNKNYDIEISPIDPATAGFTHLIKVETKDLKSEIFKLKVNGKLPNWVVLSSSENDLNIQPSNEQASKTFGLQYLLGGVVEAFYPNNKENVLNQLEISINR